jgi:hypothetical protein
VNLFVYLYRMNMNIDVVLPDKTVQLYKTSAIAQLTGRMTPSQVLSVGAGEDDVQSRRSHSERESWEDEGLLRDGLFLFFLHTLCSV